MILKYKIELKNYVIYLKYILERRFSFLIRSYYVKVISLH